MLNQYKLLFVGAIAALFSSPAYSAGYVSIGGVSNHGYGHITIGRGLYGHGHIQGHGYRISGGYYPPPSSTHSYSRHCYGVYCGGGVHYIRTTPSIDYFRGLSDAAAGVNYIGFVPVRGIVVPVHAVAPIIPRYPTINIKRAPSDTSVNDKKDSE